MRVLGLYRAYLGILRCVLRLYGSYLTSLCIGRSFKRGYGIGVFRIAYLELRQIGVLSSVLRLYRSYLGVLSGVLRLYRDYLGVLSGVLRLYRGYLGVLRFLRCLQSFHLLLQIRRPSIQRENDGAIPIGNVFLPFRSAYLVDRSDSSVIGLLHLLFPIAILLATAFLRCSIRDYDHITPL